MTGCDGSNADYQRHLTAGQVPCEASRQAHNAYHRVWHRRRKAAARNAACVPGLGWPAMPALPSPAPPG